MKIAPLYHALKRENWAVPYIVHAGQHYDLNMSDAFFNDLDLPRPDLNLGVGSGSHAEQTGHVMINYEKVLIDQKPDLVIVVGDVNSTMACAIAASKVQYDSRQHRSTVPLQHFNGPRPLIAHLEAGLRSFGRTMPEEINRLVTDTLADILWTPSPDADRNLEREGIEREKIRRVGNIMIDSLEMLRPKIEKIDIWQKFNLNRGAYGLVTLHRPSNVDNRETLETICRILMRIAGRIPILFPVHPRTRKNLGSNGILGKMRGAKNLILSEPLSYISFMNLVFNCRFVITDSGGLQEETTYLGIPCLTMRPNTERPITISNGTNRLCSPENLQSEVEWMLSGKPTQKQIPEYWDGHTAERVVNSIATFFG
jgi:UDP-N-acetylglucosamine 2-epimerase (non-hydrolysing)